MSTDISVHSSNYQVEDRSWLAGTHVTSANLHTISDNCR